jgi:tetratricopeptide (TPR) repeat protein
MRKKRERKAEMSRKRKILLWAVIVCLVCLSIGLFLSRGHISLVWQFISTGFNLPKDYSTLGAKDKIGFWGSICSIFAIPLALLICVVSTIFNPSRKILQEVEETRQETKETREAVEKLREELAINKIQAVSPKDLAEKSQTVIKPSEEAKKTAKKIPDDAGPYALAMKAVAESKFDKARKLAEKAAEEKEVELAEIYRLRGEIETYAGKYKAAAKWYKEALRLAGDDEKILREAATAFYYNAEYKEAEPLMNRALEIDEKAFGKDHPDVARDLNNLSLLLKATNRLRDAEPLMKRALEIAEKAYGENCPIVATALNNLAELYRVTNRLKEAEPLYKRALEINEKAFGEDHPNITGALNNLAKLLQATNRLKEAEPLMKRALEIDEKAFGKDHPKVAIRLNNLAVLLQATNRLKEAEPLMKRALEIDEKAFGKDHPNVATDLNNLAQLLKATNRLKEAEPLMKRALEIDEEALGKDHPNVATDLNNLALLYQVTNRSAEARPLLERALAIFEKSLGPEHPKTITVRENLEGI